MAPPPSKDESSRRKKEGRRERSARENRAAWMPIQAELRSRRARMEEMGGAARVEEKMHARGRLDARQRLAALFDPGSFREIGKLVGTVSDIPAEGFICGSGMIRGRPAFAGAEDFTVLGGSIGTGGTAKRYRIAELAMQEKAPLVMMLEGAGHRLTETDGMGRSPNDLLALADLSGHVPMVCLVLGPSAGHGALAAPLSDFVVMSERASMFTGGPPLVKAATGEDVTKEALGGPEICAEIAGSAHNVVAGDREAIELARTYLGYFPRHAGAKRPVRDDGDTGPRLLEDLVEIIPPDDRRPYDVHDVIDRVVDRDSFLEIQPGYGRGLVVGLAFMGGRAMAILANNPARQAGAVDSPAAIKAADFLEVIGHFGHPVLFLTDNPGVMAGRKAERSGILKWGGRMFRAERRLANPKIHVTLRKAFGFGAVTMAQNPFDKQTLCLSLPGVTMGAMPAESGGAAAKLDAEAQARAEAAQRSGTYRMAHHLVYDDVIDPTELRNRILDGLATLSEE
ncbi:MAG TPA: acetyl-CoA carboxylase carboxyltransferase subunit [Deltaproteobacteria bacterium]|nr:acetyl-CoA carboxylase carboxyltransferase subunit [Deltaproteobacteria bacterium]